MVGGLADVGGHRHQLPAGGLRSGEDDVDGGAHEGHRCAQLVACVGDEPPLAGERGLEPFEHRIEGVGELTQLITGALQGYTLGQVLLAGHAGSRGEPVHRPQDAPGGDPARKAGEECGACQGEQRVGQQVAQRRVELRDGAGLDTLGIQPAALHRDVGGRVTPGLPHRDALRDLLLDRPRDRGGRRGVQGVRY
jgi:hypothetical protein